MLPGGRTTIWSRATAVFRSDHDLAAALRFLALPLPGTSDVRVFQEWTRQATTGKLTEIYGVGGSPPAPLPTPVDYPPVAVYHLAAVGHVYHDLFPSFPGGARLTMAIKLLIMLATALLTAVIWWVVRRDHGVETARLAAALYWANPAVLLYEAVLGYLDVLAFLPAVGAIVCAFTGRARMSGALFALACLTKPQGLLVAPAIIVALTGTSRPAFRQWKAAAVGAVVTTGVVLAPYVMTGALFNVTDAVWSLVTYGYMSGNAANVWWLVGYSVDVGRQLERLGLVAFAVPARIFDLAELFALGPRVGGRSLGTLAITAISWVPVLGVVGWASRRSRGVPGPGILFALTALTVHAYFVLVVQVHENHMFLVLPVLAMVAVECPPYRRLLALLSAVVILNLNFFEGFGEGIGFALPRSITFIDATVLLAAANVAAFIWHVRLFRRLCGQAPAPVPAATSDVCP